MILSNAWPAGATLAFRAETAGTLTNRPVVSLAEPDPDPGNNFAELAVTVNPQPVVSVRDAAVREGSGAGGVSFTFTLSGASSLPVSVGYQTMNGTALAGVDYNTNAGVVTFNPGVVSRVVNLPILLGNALVQSNRFFYLNLVAATNAVLSNTQAIALIVEDDFRLVSATGVSVLEGPSGVTNAQFRITLTPPSPVPVTVDYRTMDVTTTTGADYLSRAGALLFAPGVTNLTLSVPIIGDTRPEIDESFSLAFLSPSNAALSVNAVPGTILNDDLLPPLAITSIVWQRSDLQLGFASVGGRRYRLERSPSLLTNSWVTVLDAILGTGDFLGVPDPNAASRPEGFYRLVQLP